MGQFYLLLLVLAVYGYLEYRDQKKPKRYNSGVLYKVNGYKQVSARRYRRKRQREIDFSWIKPVVVQPTTRILFITGTILWVTAKTLFRAGTFIVQYAQKRLEPEYNIPHLKAYRKAYS